MVNFKKPIYSLLPLVLLGSLQSTSRATAMYFADSSSYLIFASPLPTGLSSTTSSIGVSSVSILLTSMSDAAAYGLNSNGVGTSISEVHAYSEAQTGGHSFNTLPGSHSATDANSNRYNITFTNSSAVLATLELGWSFHIHAADRSNLGASSSAYASACFSTPTFTTFSTSLASPTNPNVSADSGAGLALVIGAHRTLTFSVWSLSRGLASASGVPEPGAFALICGLVPLAQHC